MDIGDVISEALFRLLVIFFIDAKPIPRQLVGARHITVNPCVHNKYQPNGVHSAL